MYKKVGQRETLPENFELPFNDKLPPENPWLVMASLISWWEFGDKYAVNFSIGRCIFVG